MDLTGAGGAERLLWEEEKFLRERGVDVIVLSFSLDDSALYNYHPHNIEIIKCKNYRLSRIIALRYKIKQLNPDLIIASSYLDSMYLYLVTLFLNIPYIVHIHGTFFWFIDDFMKYSFIHRKVFSEIMNSVAGHKEFIRLKPECGFLRRLASECFAILDYLAVRKAKKIIVLTDQIKWEVKKLYGKESIIARGCLSEEALNYRPRINIKNKLGLDGKRIILSIGRLDPRKRIDLLIKSFARILPNYDDVYLIIGGTGRDEERLKILANELNIIDRVRFVGFIPDNELFDYYAACDIFAFPSWTTSGITPYEALAVGKKVVWTTEADEPILNDKHVFLANPTVEDFTIGLKKALNTRVEEKIDLSNYTWNRYFETVYDVAVKAVKPEVTSFLKRNNN